MQEFYLRLGEDRCFFPLRPALFFFLILESSARHLRDDTKMFLQC